MRFVCFSTVSKQQGVGREQALPASHRSADSRNVVRVSASRWLSAREGQAQALPRPTPGMPCSRTIRQNRYGGLVALHSTSEHPDAAGSPRAEDDRRADVHCPPTADGRPPAHPPHRQRSGRADGEGNQLAGEEGRVDATLFARKKKLKTELTRQHHTQLLYSSTLVTGYLSKV